LASVLLARTDAEDNPNAWLQDKLYQAIDARAVSTHGSAHVAQGIKDLYDASDAANPGSTYFSFWIIGEDPDSLDAGHRHSAAYNDKYYALQRHHVTIQKWISALSTTQTVFYPGIVDPPADQQHVIPVITTSAHSARGMPGNIRDVVAGTSGYGMLESPNANGSAVIGFVEASDGTGFDLTNFPIYDENNNIISTVDVDVNTNVWQVLYAPMFYTYVVDAVALYAAATTDLDFIAWMGAQADDVAVPGIFHYTDYGRTISGTGDNTASSETFRIMKNWQYTPMSSDVATWSDLFPVDPVEVTDPAVGLVRVYFSGSAYCRELLGPVVNEFKQRPSVLSKRSKRALQRAQASSSSASSGTHSSERKPVSDQAPPPVASSKKRFRDCPPGRQSYDAWLESKPA